MTNLIADSNAQGVLDQLMAQPRLTPNEAAAQWKAVPGVYAIFIDEPASLPAPYADVLRERQTSLIYLGKASKSLVTRCCDQELRHKQPATFFRTLGAVLGYLPPAGSLAGKRNQHNYRFSPADTRRIIAWIDAHLSVSAIELPAREVITVEGELIGLARPLLNLQDNPDRLPPLAAARSRCRAIARGEMKTEAQYKAE